jgi:hypothetical protein
MAVNPKTGRTIGGAKESDGKITTKGRLALSASDFALPPGEEEKRRGIKGRYPINDEAHARNALARVRQNGTRAEQATVVRKVQAKYPNIEISGDLLRIGRRG